MDQWTRAYLLGTDPSSSFSDLLCTDVMMSILFYSILYTIILVGIGFLLQKTVRILPTISITFLLFVFVVFVAIMIVGYPCRLWRAKSLFKYTNSLSRTQSVMDSAYSRWYFLG
jgi:hypothetical protein